MEVGETYETPIRMGGIIRRGRRSTASEITAGTSYCPARCLNNVAMENARFRWLYLLFFVSGFPALIYQIVWQRALFAIYGVNIESVTVVVSAFMLGLGLGSLAGGR